MNEQEIKRKLLKQIELDLSIKGEILKSQDLIFLFQLTVLNNSRNI